MTTQPSPPDPAPTPTSRKKSTRRRTPRSTTDSPRSATSDLSQLAEAPDGHRAPPEFVALPWHDYARAAFERSRGNHEHRLWFHPTLLFDNGMQRMPHANQGMLRFAQAMKHQYDRVARHAMVQGFIWVPRQLARSLPPAESKQIGFTSPNELHR